jgi:hypothetical protein
MTILVADHHLKDFDRWFEMFTDNPPPDIGDWRLIRGIDDPNRVQVIGEITAADVDDVKEYFESEKMQKVFVKVNELSTSPVTFTWFTEVNPG